MDQMKTICFRIEIEKIAALDAVGSEMERSRTDIINEAIDNYLQLMQCHTEQIKAGLRETDEGQLI